MTQRRITDRAVMARIRAWSRSRDTGISSLTMVALSVACEVLVPIHYDSPHDPSDFGRCYRLLGMVPEIRGCFDSIGAGCPQFAPILEAWDELAAIYERDLPSGRSDELYDRLTTMRIEFLANERDMPRPMMLPCPLDQSHRGVVSA